MEPEEPDASPLKWLAASLQQICSSGRRDSAGHRSPTDPPAADRLSQSAHDHIGSSPPSNRPPAEEGPSSSDDEEIPGGSSPSADRPDVERLLPPDYGEIMLRMVAPVGRASKEEVYRLLSNSVLIDEGKKSFALDTSTGKKCYMLSAMDLDIEWGHDERYWGWTSLPGSRFPEVAVLLKVWWFQITGEIDARELSPGTTYAAYLVFATCEQRKGLSDYQEASIKVGGDESKCRVCLAPMAVESSVPQSSEPRENLVRLPRLRDDGWMEMELGEFFIDQGSQQKVVQMQVMDVDTSRKKRGLILEGMEVRPKGADG